MTNLDKTKNILARLVAYPTVSKDSNLALINYCAELLEKCGARIFLHHNTDKTKANLFATLGPDGDDGIVLSGHTDVVPVKDQVWASDPFELREHEGLLYGRGTCDMKGFIAAALSLAPDFAKANLKRPIHYSLTYDEETGCLGAAELVQELQRRQLKPSVVIIGEPTSMRIIEGHKGCYEYSTEFVGLEGHGSAPEAGVSAVEYAVRYVTKLLELREQLKQRVPANSPFDPPYTTLQVGRMEGGQAHNVIAGRCQVDWEMRPVQSSDADFVKSTINNYCEDKLLPAMHAVHKEAAINLHTIAEVVGLEPADHNEARELVSRLTGSNHSDVVSFGTEGGLFQSMGSSVVVCGPGSIEQAHKPDEYISVEQLQSCLDMLQKLLIDVAT